MSERFFCAEGLESGRPVRLGAAEARHISRVLRLAPGDCVELFDGTGAVWRASIRSASRDAADLELVARLDSAGATHLACTIACAVPKGERARTLVEKLTELGVDRLTPTVTRRSIVEPGAGWRERSRRWSIEACKQSLRAVLLECTDPVPFGTLVRDCTDPVRWIALRGAAPAPLRELADARAITIAIGPEGGFEDEEVAQAQAAGWRPVGLGPHVLRIETAAIAAASLVAHCRGAAATATPPG